MCGELGLPGLGAVVPVVQAYRYGTGSVTLLTAWEKIHLDKSAYIKRHVQVNANTVQISKCLSEKCI